MNELKIALVGLDSSHSIEFTRRFQAPDCPDISRVDGIRVTDCLRFETPFVDSDGLDQRQKQLEEWGVRVTESLEDAVRDVDAIMIEINDSTLHSEFFERLADRGVPLFLDKPLADTVANGRRILEMAGRHQTRWFSASSLRFAAALGGALKLNENPSVTAVYGALGKAAAGSSIIWYGVHAFEMLECAMGRGARAVTACRDESGVVVTVDYGGRRRGVVELTEGAYVYGGVLRSSEAAYPFVVDASAIYSGLLRQVASFFRGAPAPVDPEDSLEIMALMVATDRSLETGQSEPVSP